MVSKNNVQLKDRYATKQVPHYGIRKLSVGVASVLLSTTLYMGVTAHADTIAETSPQPTIDQPASTATGNATGSVQLKPTADQSASTTTNSPVSETNASSKSVQTVSPEQPADTTDVQPASGQSESAAANSNAPENNGSAKLAPTALPKQPANSDTQSAATTSGVQPFVNLAVESDNNDLTPKHETIDSQWIIHYVNQADHQQELKDPTVITMQYTRTDTPHSDGTTQYGDWSYVPGSFKQTGTPITVKDSNNPVKQDNVDKNGENFDVFTITAMYPTVAGYGFYNGINGTRLRDNLRNNERQADSMSKDFYAEYELAKPTRETVGSQWRIHYIDSTNREHELKAPTVINMQYARTNTPQSDGTIQHGDWSYVSGSFKLTGTQITVNDSDNPVKEDNVDKNGQNVDTFTINAMYPSITGYNFHDGINNAHLHDYLLNYDPNGTIQAPTMGKDFYVEYDPISERSVAVKFVDDQLMGQQVGQAVTLTGRDGDTVDLKLTVPDKYKLADGQQLPTTYTFAKGSGDLTIHLVHQVVQREATINFQLGLETFVDFGDNSYEPAVLTQARWKQLEEEAKNGHGPVLPGGEIPFTEVGTLTGHVGYDLVDEEAVSFGDDWTSLNLGSRTYQLPNGTDVVNGILTDSDDTMGKKLKEYYLNEYRMMNSNKQLDPDYANRPWHGYLSVNATNNTQTPGAYDIIRSGLQAGLAGNEPNALAKATGDRAATAVELVNKTIDVSWLQDNLDFGARDFSEHNGQLKAKTGWGAFGVYIPYVEKTVTRTINVTTPDGKTTAVKQTATLAKQVDFGKDAHPAWTTGEWASYEVPTIPGYTVSQSQVAKEAVTGTTEDQTVNITYTANPQTATVVYQAEDGTPVHTTTVNGHTGQTVKVSNEVPVGWHVVNGTVPSEITFGSNGTPKTVVTIAHSHATVTPDAPKTTSDKLPDNPAKTYPAGVSHDDLNKTVTRTIKVTTPDGQTKTVAQTAKLTCTADVDEVTGEVTYGQWTTSQWGAYDVPTVPGYTASQTSVAATPVDGNTKNQTIDISYTANSQTIHINYVDDDNAGKIVHATTVTGKTGETVSLNLTVPDKYRLADGQQLPTTYTFAKGSGDLTIRLAHKVVQREAAVDVQIGLMTLVTFSDDEDEPGIVVTQNQWRQLDDEIKDSEDFNSDEVFPSVEVGTLTGHVGYDLVDNQVVSFNDDWTSLNLGGQTYQMPDGTEVVNGMFIDSRLSWGKTLKEQYLKYYPDTDLDYVNRAWHGYLSANKTNEMAPGFVHNELQAGLVGNEPNKLAKVIGDQAATAVKIANKTIDSNWLKGNFDTSEFSEQNGRLQGSAKFDVVGFYIPYVEKTATRTINVTTPDGKTTSVKQTATLAKQINFGKDAHSAWTTGEWSSYDVPTIPGYTVSQSSVAKETVTGTTEDQTVNITYTANPQATTVVYQTEDGTPVHTTTVNGKTGQTVKVSNEVPAGWHIVNGNVPNEIIFGPDGASKTVITIAHSHVTVTPDVPKTTSDKLPDNQGETYPAGVGHDDLNKTVTGTIKVTMPDGQIKTVVKAAHLTRTADVDEVTGEVTYSDWTTGYWSDYTAPSVPGYTANYPYIAGQSVDGETEDQTIEITYTANPQTTHVNYVDTQGKLVHTTTVNGQTDQTVKVPSEIPDGWKLVDGQTVPNTITFGPDGHADTSVKIEYKYVTVDPDRPQTNGTKLPDNPKQSFHGVEASDLNKTITRTINVTMPTGKINTIKQTVQPTRFAYVDEVTGAVSYGEWTTGQWDAYKVPTVAGYTATQTEVSAVSVNEHTTNQTVNVSYTPNKQTTTVKYIDDQGEVVHTTTVNGAIDQTVKVSSEVPAGWTITKGQVPSELTFGADGHEPIEVTIAHQHVTVTPDHPQDNGTKLPDNPAKTFNGVEVNDLNKTITRTIKVTTPDGQTKTVAQTAKLTRTADVDEVTGQVTYGDWTTDEWAAYDAPSVAGYVPSQAKVDKETVTAASKETTTVITYSPMQHQISVEYVDDDDHGKVVKTDQVPGKTDQTITVMPTSPVNYELVDSNNRTYMVTSADGQTVQIHVKHHQVTTSESKTVTRTINVHTPHDVVKTVKQTVTLNRDVTTDQVTGDKTYGGWTTGQWKAYTPEAISGYTPSTNEVPNTNVDGSSSDQTVDVNYTADPQKVEIVYVDDAKGGAVVKTDQVSGKTDETVKVTPDVPASYNVVGEIPGSYTMTANGHQTITVHLMHQKKTTSEDKTVTRTINVHTPHDGVKTIKQTATLTRAVTTDQVTGEKTYGDWSATLWDHYAVPAVAGYVPSIKQVAQQVVNGTTTDQMIDVTYSSGEHTTHINYVDGDGNVVHTTTIKGQTDGTAQVPNETPAGWTVIGEPVPTELVFGPDGHADVTVTVGHQHVTVTPNQPKTSGDKLPDNPAKTYPNGVGHDELNKTITRTIKITTPDGQTKTVEQTAKLTRTADVDEVTGEVTYGDWTTGAWSSYDVPVVPGYTSSQSEVPATKVTDTIKDQTVTISYTANNQTTTIDYVDQNGKTVHTTVVNGHTDQTVKVPNEMPAGWTITNGQVPTEITFGPDGHADVTVTVGHQHVIVTPDQPKTPSDKLLNNPSKTYPSGVGHDDLNKTITRTIKVTTPAGKTDTIKQTAKLIRTADVDEVTGEVTYGKWTTGTWSSYTVPAVSGYTPSQGVVDEVAVNADTTNQTVKITYTADSHTTHINYVDENGNVVHTTMVTGQTDQTVKVPNETPAGWTITTGQVPSEVTFGADGHTDVTVSIDHQTVTVTPDHPQADGTKLPDNPALTFHDVDRDDLNKTVTRIIKLNVPGQDPQVITQTARLTRTATVDEVTGEVTYGNWTSGQWDAYEVPAVDGYTASQTTIPAVNVTSETTSQEIVVDYVAVPTAQTTPSNNQTDENQVTSEKVTTGTVQETKQDAIKNSAQSTVQDIKQLPQTGNDKQTGLLSLIGSSLMASLAIFGLSKKKKHEN